MKSDENSIIQYVAGNCSEDELLEMDYRMASDPSLLARIQSIFYLKEHFEDIWNHMSASDYARIKQASELSKTLEKATETYPDLKAHMHSIMQRYTESAKGGIRVLMDRAKGFACVACNDARLGWSSQLQLGFGGIGSPDSELADILQEAKRSLEEDQSDNARNLMEKATTIDFHHTGHSSIQCMKEGQEVAEITTDCQRSSVEIRVPATHESNAPSLAIAIPSSDPENSQVWKFEFIEEEKCKIAVYNGTTETELRIILV